MAVFIDPLPALAFSHELDRLDISAEGETSLGIRIGGSLVLETILSPDAQGRIGLHDIGSFLREHITSGLSTVTFCFEDHGEAVTVIPSRIDTLDTAVHFVENHFLTRLQGPKPTFLNATEYLSLYYAGKDLSDRLTVTCLWVDAETGEIRETAGRPAYLTGSGHLWNFGLLPADFKAPSSDFQLHSFRAEVDGRRQDFVLRGSPDAVPLSLVFLNNFGQRETFHFFGTVEKEWKPVLSSASFSGTTRNYRTEVAPTWKARTGPLPDAVQPLFEDLCAATGIWRAEDETELAVTDCENKISNDFYEVQSGTLTFRESSRMPSFKKKERQRTFDDTFDNTFF